MKKLKGFSVYFMLALVWVLAIPSGCALIGDPIAERVAKTVEKYCGEPLSYRTIYANTVNSHLTQTGHVVHVHCAGDPTPP